MTFANIRIATAPKALQNQQPIITSFVARESLSQLYSFVLTLHTQQAIEPNELLRQSIGVTASTSTQRHFHGMIMQVRRHLSTQHQHQHQHQHQYQLTLRPSVSQLTMTQQNQIFANKTVIEIIHIICAHHGIHNVDLSQLSNRNYPPLRYLTQYQECDWEFIERLLCWNQIHYFFTHQTDQHTLHLIDKPDWKTATEELNHTTTSSTYKRRITTHQHHDYHHRSHNSESIGRHPAQHAATPTHKRAESLQSHHYITEHSATCIKPSLAQQLHHIDTTGQQLAARTSSILTLAPGTLYKVTSADGGDGTVLIDQVMHVFQPRSGHINRKNNLTALPYLNHYCYHSTLDYPTRSHIPAPTAPGPQPAVVIGPTAHTVHTNASGCVKVQFRWNTANNARPISDALWVRVQQSMAGDRYGSIHLPRVGTHVLVDFIHGDLNEPIVIACIHPHDQASCSSGDSQPGYASLSAAHASDISPTQRSEIRFNDSNGNLGVTALRNLESHTVTDYRHLIKGDHATTITSGEYRYRVSEGEYRIQAQHAIRLSAAGHDITLTPSTITIQATDIMLNS